MLLRRTPWIKAGMAPKLNRSRLIWAMFGFSVGFNPVSVCFTCGNSRSLPGTAARDQDWYPHWIEMTPMQRCGEPHEIASTALFLASDASSFFTGSVLSVDGGYTAW